jgi:hypothetical protein
MTPSHPTSATGEELGRRALRLRFDEFGWARLELEARRDGEALDDLLSRAAAYFYAERPTGRAATLAPGFKPDARGEPREVRLEGDAECWEGLESEAQRQGVPMERLLEHAALLYLADSDSGRLAERWSTGPNPQALYPTSTSQGEGASPEGAVIYTDENAASVAAGRSRPS